MSPRGRLLVNDITYADLSVRFEQAEDVDTFLIGAHAAVKGWPLLTRDAGRYRSYFPAVTLLTPHG